MFRIRLHFLLLLLAALISLTASPVPAAEPAKPSAEDRRARQREDAQKQGGSLRKLAARLRIGPGSVIADIGAGSGRDTWTFAEIVGAGGRVFAEEIEEKKVNGLNKEAKERNLSQVQVVLGGAEDPNLPAGSVDMAYMNRVYHHFSKPRKMLQGIWHALKPGGRLVIVDQHLGTLQDWVPREERARKHYWIAETTVVREAREQGYHFVDYAEDLWHSKQPFVLIFQRPLDLDAPDRDPDQASSLPAATIQELLPPSGEHYSRVAFVALGAGRTMIGPLLDAMDCNAIDIVLEEWATQKEERPSLPAGVTLPSLLTENGDPKLDDRPLDAIYFLDTYHLLFHGHALLSQFHARLTSSGRVYVLDRQAPKPIPHREASHRRMIASETVQREMINAGFTLVEERPKPTSDRFLLIFRKSDSWDREVTQYGEMREVLGKGDHSGRIRLGDAIMRPNCYAVGALADLAGEITMIDGKVIVTRADENHRPVTQAADPELYEEEAAMLATAYVPRWTEHPVPEDVASHELEKFLAAAAHRAGLDPTRPFPFLIEGTLADLRLHVICGACPMRARRLGQELPPEREPHRGSFAETTGTIIGMYAEDAEHRLTHHGTKTHMHAVLRDDGSQQYTGHIESVGLRAGSIVRLPVR
jgi:ubiquinone/menaquinone biosynthesis C-methylase UbiE